MKNSILSTLFLCLAALSSSAQTGSATPLPPQQYADLGDLKLESGAVIHDCRLGFRTLGTLNAERSNAILYPTWFTGNSAQILPQLSAQGLFDPSRYFIIAVDALGDGVSCSPSNSATQPGPAFPGFTIRDMVESEHRLLTEKLGLKHLRAVMGTSMGGMQTFQWVVSYPTFMDLAIPIVGTPRQTSYDMLLWRSEEQAIVADPFYMFGKYTHSPDLPLVQLIHSMNLTTPKYRVEHTSPQDFAAFFDQTLHTTNGAFDANDWRWQIHAMLAQDIAPRASLDQAAHQIKARMLIINSRQDHMVDPIPALAFAPLIRAQTLVLEGDCGHLAPGCEVDKIRPILEKFLAQP